MEQILENLYNYHGETDLRVLCSKEEQRIKTRRGNFKKILKQNQYRQMQRLLDNTDNVTCKMSISNFTSRVRFGVKFMIEIYAVNDDKFDFGRIREVDFFRLSFLSQRVKSSRLRLNKNDSF